MIQELAQNSDMQWMSILSMLFFLTFFCTMAALVFRTDPEKLNEYGKIPLKEDLPADEKLNNDSPL